jgi:hypothetical protein
MFNLEQSISEWRKQMLAGGIKAPVPLDELESHLRDEIERQMKSGVIQKTAFESAVQEIGKPDTVNMEFKKINLTTGKQMKQIAIILAALFGTAFGGAMVLPALGIWKKTGNLHLSPLSIGIIIVLISSGIVVGGIKTYRQERGRKLIGAFTIAAALFYTMPLLQGFFIPNVNLSGWIFCILLAMASVLFYGSCLYFLRHSHASRPTFKT